MIESLGGGGLRLRAALGWALFLFISDCILQADRPRFVQSTMKKKKFFDWITESVERLVQSSHASAPSLQETLAKMQDPLVFFNEFGNYTTVLAMSSDVGDFTFEGAAQATKEKYETWRKSQPLAAAAHALGDVLNGTLTFQFDEQFQNLAGRNVEFSEYFRIQEAPEKDDLQVAYAAFAQSVAAAPVSSAAKQPGAQMAPVDLTGAAATAEEESERDHMWKHLCEKRRLKVNFLALPTVGAGKKLYAPNGPLSSIYQQSKAYMFKGKPGESHRLLLGCADLALPLPPATSKTDDEIVKAVATLTPEFEESLVWMKSFRGECDVVALFDGRSRECRRKIEDWSDKNYPDEHRKVEMWITYVLSEAAAADIRTSQRKVAFGAVNKEAGLVHLPVPKIRMKTKTRDSFHLCGESTTHAATYTGVHVRPLEELPRMTPSEKAAITGQPAHIFQKERIVQEIAIRGVPISWPEAKPITLYTSLYRDYNVDRIWDNFAGSGGAAIAALYTNTPYEGVCVNQEHKNWLDSILDMAFFAILSEKKDKKDATKEEKEMAASVLKYFNGTVQCAAQFLYQDRETDDKGDDEKSDDDEENGN